MKKIIKHYPMTDRLIVRRGYISVCTDEIVHWKKMIKFARNMIPVNAKFPK